MVSILGLLKLEMILFRNYISQFVKLPQRKYYVKMYHPYLSGLHIYELTII